MPSQAVFLSLLMEKLPYLNILFEQPSGSWGYKQPFMISLATSLQLFLRRIKPDIFYVFSPSFCIDMCLSRDKNMFCMFKGGNFWPFQAGGDNVARSLRT